MKNDKTRKNNCAVSACCYGLDPVVWSRNMELKNYRFLRNGNGKWKIQKKGLLWWNDLGQMLCDYGGVRWGEVMYFQSEKEACQWLTNAHQSLKDETSYRKRSKTWEVVDIKCSSTLTSKEPNG